MGKLINIDNGGTLTDFCVTDGNKIYRTKTLTTPFDLSKCFIDGTSLSPEQIAAQGGNKSLIHIDWMIGSDQIDIDGLYADGRRVPVFRKGEWA